MASRHDKEKGVNVQVLLRCRPFSEDELRSNAPQVITCHEQHREVSVSQNIAGKQHDRTFTFDKVFGPQSQQKDLYDQAIVPIVNEVLEGFNCTIFAYGQTGTGKTYTMEGAGRKARNGELPADAGVIPRAIKQIFETLELQNAEYSVKVTFLELYNEEITDLLAPEEICKVLDDKRRPIALMEDGKGGVLVRGLEEEIVTNSTEIFNLLDRGSAKRRTAETLLNKQSSRSHSIFSITIHIKEATPEGEDLIKCGKLNLVDLAGSENICRSGAREGRAREAGEINKSLLTLGRVITSLVEHLGHVPYRDSKLTRLLRDSLGGRTKTCIIATVSPSVHCLEETLSTLDYAQRAKSIKNKPEVNQKMMKTTLIKDLYAEIDRLKADIHAAREKNGVYIPRDRFYQEEAEKKAMAEKFECMEEEVESNRKLLDEMQARYDLEHELCKEIGAQLDLKQKELEQTQQTLIEAKENIRQAYDTINEKDFIIMNQQESEAALLKKTVFLHSNLEQTVQDVSGLFEKIERKEQVEAGNMKLVQNFQSDFCQQLENLRKAVNFSVGQQQEQLASFEEQLQTFMSTKINSAEELKKKVEDLKILYFARLQGLHELAQSHESGTDLILDKVNNATSGHALALQNLLRDAVLEAELVLRDLQTTLLCQQKDTAAFAQQQREGAHFNMQTIQNISKTTLDAFQQLGTQAAELSRRIDASSLAQEHSLAEFENTFEEQAREEEQQMLQGISEMFAKAKSRKSALVHAMVSSLREHATSEKHHYKDSVKTVGNLACETQSKWKSYMKQSEDNTAEELGRMTERQNHMEGLIQNCVKGTDDASKQWRKARTSIEHHTKSHVPIIESIVREAKEFNVNLLTNLEHESSTAQAEVEAHNTSLFEHVRDSVNFEHEAQSVLQCSIVSQLQTLANLQSCHHTNLEEMHRFSVHSLVENYKEDPPTLVTPERRVINVPSISSIEKTCDPGSEKLLKKYRERNGACKDKNAVTEQENVTIRNSTAKSSPFNEAPAARIPLSRLN